MINKNIPLPISENNTFFNLTSDPDISSASSILKFGLKHIPNSGDISNAEIWQAFKKFKHSTLWQIHHGNEPDFEYMNPIIENSFNPKLKNKTKRLAKFPAYLYHNIPDSTHQIFKILKKRIGTYINKYKPNHKPDDTTSAIRKLRTSKPNIIFKPADKNIGTVALPFELYDELVLKHLSDKNRYQTIGDLTKTELITNEVSKRSAILLELDDKEGFFSLSDPEIRFIKTFSNFVIPHFYVLPKLHKTGPLSSRPICASINWYTTPFSIILTLRLETYIKQKVKNNCKNSFQVVQDLETFTNYDKDNISFVTGDVEALYPNINIKKLLDTFIQTPDLIHLEPIARFILRNNFIQYKDLIYLQTTGIAMGTNVAVALADIYMHHLYDTAIKNLQESNYNNIIYFRRYIDDYFFLLKNTNESQFTEFTNLLSKDLKINWDSPTEKVNFLDINIKMNQDKIETSVFQKTLNKYLYITPHSLHAPHTFAGFIKGELIRYARLSTNIFNFIFLKKLFYSRLRNRGFAHAFLLPIFRKIDWSIRFERTFKQNSKILPFVIPYSKRKGMTSLKKQFYETANRLKVYSGQLHKHRPLFVYGRKRNICELLAPTKLNLNNI